MGNRLRHALATKAVKRPEQYAIEFPFCSVVEQRSELLSPVGTLPPAFMLNVTRESRSLRAYLHRIGRGHRKDADSSLCLRQETELRGDEDLRRLGGEKFGKVVAISVEDRTVDIKKRRDTANVHPEAVFAHQIVDAQVLADALVRIGEYVADHGLSGEGPYQAARDLLLLTAPHTSGETLKETDETSLAAAIRLAPHLDGVLPIQGPPGAGKPLGARMICTLRQIGKNIGVTANSHKVIRNVLDEVVKAAPELDTSVQCIQKVSEEEPCHPFCHDVELLRCASRHGILIQCKPVECGNLSCKRDLCIGRIACGF
jgi:hypothetical protein